MASPRLLSLLLLLAPLPAGASDVLVLRDGRRLEVDSWWEDGRTIRYEKYGGTVGIPRDLIAEILEGDDGSDRRGGPPRVHAYAPLPAAPAPPEAAAVPAGRIAALAVDLPGHPSGGGSLDDQLRALEQRLIASPGDKAGLARPIATLLTRRGNDHLHAGDVDGALADYRRAVGLDPTLIASRINLAVALLAQSRNAEALSEVDQVLREQPEQPDALFLRGEALYRDERMDQAIRAWRRAEEVLPSPRTRDRLEKALREQEVGGAYGTSAAAHFLLRYDEARADDHLGGEILDFLESHFDRMVSRYNVLPESVIVVILYPTAEFHHVTQTTASTAGLFDGKIRVPIGDARTMNDRLRETLIHELTHSFVFAKTRGNCPTWLQEGLAQHEEGRRASAATLADLARDYRSHSAGWGTELDYDSSLALTQFLIARYGFGAMLGVLDRLRHGASDAEAIRRTLGTSIDEIVRSWGESLVRENAS